MAGLDRLLLHLCELQDKTDPGPTGPARSSVSALGPETRMSAYGFVPDVSVSGTLPSAVHAAASAAAAKRPETELGAVDGVRGALVAMRARQTLRARL